MRNSVTLGVSQNRLHTVRSNLKLLCDFGDAQAVVEVIDNRVAGIRVPSSTAAPLCTPGLISTSGQSDQSILGLIVIGGLPATMIPYSML
jgi:hypothetical protein